MSKNRKERKKRIPLGGHKAKMSISPGLVPDGMVPRWFNDVDNRINDALNAGYEFVKNEKGSKVGDGSENGNTDIGSKISKIVGTTKTNTPMKAYLMMIRRDWYEEDQAEKQKKVDVVDKAIKNPGFGIDKQGVDKRHTYGKIDYKA